MDEQARTNHSGLTPGVDFDMERAGADLRIPQDEWANPALQELVGFMVRVDELQQGLFQATLQAAHAPLPPFLGLRQ